jgi:hypothetical protein
MYIEGGEITEIVRRWVVTVEYRVEFQFTIRSHLLFRCYITPAVMKVSPM